MRHGTFTRCLIGALTLALGCTGASPVGQRSTPQTDAATDAVDPASAGDLPADGLTTDFLADGIDAQTEISDRVPYRATAIASGKDHVCALLDDGRVKCWGYNLYGQLGLGDTKTRGQSPDEMGDALPAVDLGQGRTVTALTAARYSTCAILDNHALKCWGWGGLIGQGELNNRGDAPDEMGDALPAVDLGPGRSARLVSVGEYQSCAILDDGAVRCWAQERPVTMALPPGINVVGISQCTGACILLDDGRVLQPLLFDSPTVLPRVVDLGGAAARTIAGAEVIGCALLRRGGTICWGEATVTRPPETADLQALAIGTLFSCGIEAGGAVRCWGGPPNQSTWQASELGLVRLERPAIQLVAGFAHACALLDDHTVRCWGVPNSGVLGGAPLAPVDLGTR